MLEIFDAWPRAGNNSPTLDVPIHPNTALIHLGIVISLPVRLATRARASGRSCLTITTGCYSPGCSMRYLSSSSDAAHSGLALRAFAEMLGLSDVGRLLTTLPRMEGDDQARAGAPFELPYSLAFPDLPNERWAYHENCSTLRACSSDRSAGRATSKSRSWRLRSSLRAADAFVAMHTN